MAGNTVELATQRIRINQTWLPNSQVATKDIAGRPLPHLPFCHYPVQPGGVWLLSIHAPKSYDSRYFGPILEARITNTVTTLWTGD